MQLPVIPEVYYKLPIEEWFRHQYNPNTDL